MKATRKGGMKKRRAAIVEAAVSRWNRPDGVPKRCANLLETMRVFLENVDTVSLTEYARLLYVKNAAKNPDIAKEFVAISSNVTLINFLQRWESIDERPLDSAQLEQAVAQRLITEAQANEVRALLKEDR
ncbi:MAG TPA: hypothetical protein VN950_01250 [Terriglobales bacterium]|nr:hypothetical protein [Terriglobales bacterium]